MTKHDFMSQTRWCRRVGRCRLCSHLDIAFLWVKLMPKSSRRVFSHLFVDSIFKNVFRLRQRHTRRFRHRTKNSQPLGEETKGPKWWLINRFFVLFLLHSMEEVKPNTKIQTNRLDRILEWVCFKRGVFAQACMYTLKCTSFQITNGNYYYYSLIKWFFI